ncbi:MAG: hypothetical protein LBK18_06195 [Prevotellaceae bacterium]|jgi:hypothetical protein|nr:hypothetical protein [Prevotellaceae bacterium]
MELTDALYSSMVKRGAIFISGAFKHIDHPKFFLVMGENEAQEVGYFYINSNVNRYVAANPERMAMQMYIKHDGYPDFLKHGSFIGAHELTTIPKNELTARLKSGAAAYRGELTPDDLDRLLLAVRSSKLFTDEEKEIVFKL